MATVTRRREWVGKGAKRLGNIPPSPVGLPPVSGYVAWYDFSDLSTLTVSGQLVTAVADKSASGFNLSGTGAPSVAFDYTTGRAVVRLQFRDHFTNDSVGMSDRTFSAFVVGMLPSLSSSVSSTFTLLAPGNGDGGNQFRVESTSGQLRTLKADLSGIGQQGNAAVTAGVTFVAGQVLTATDVTHYMGTTSETDSDSTTFTGGLTLSIGQFPSAFQADLHQFYGWLGEVVIYDTSLSSGNALSVIAYLKTKWAVA